VSDDVVSKRAEEEIKILADAQTSGGLLVALSPGDVDQYMELVEDAVVIGSLTSEKSLEVV
jgi:selenophosphate synthase